MEVRILGAGQLADLAARARKAGRKDLTQEMRQAFRASAAPLRTVVLERLPVYMPDTYAAVLAGRLKVKAQIRTVGSGAGMKMVGTAAGNPRPRKVDDLEEGRLRHPLYGNRKYWYTQAIRPGFFTEPMTEKADQVRAELQKAADRIAAKIEGA